MVNAPLSKVLTIIQLKSKSRVCCVTVVKKIKLVSEYLVIRLAFESTVLYRENEFYGYTVGIIMETGRL